MSTTINQKVLHKNARLKYFLWVLLLRENALNDYDRILSICDRSLEVWSGLYFDRNDFFSHKTTSVVNCFFLSRLYAMTSTSHDKPAQLQLFSLRAYATHHCYQLEDSFICKNKFLSCNVQNIQDIKLNTV